MASTLLAPLLAAFTGDTSCTILQFTASWCQPCRQMQPAIDQLRSSGWDVRTIDTDQQRAVAQQFKVENLPTLVILSGGREVDRIVGRASHAQIEKRVLRAAARNGPGPARGPAQASGQDPRFAGSQVRSSQAAAAAMNSQPIVRGQSPGISAIPRAVANTLASTAVGGGISSDAPSRGSPATPTRQLTIDQAIDRAAKATVRVRVDEGNTLAFGTGTIVDVRGDEALVLTCGHLFRDMQPGTQLTVDLFTGTPQEINVPSELIDFSADDVDIGLISMRIPVMIEPVEILPRNTELRVDQPVFSFGCDHGANPTRRDTRITRVNRYTGAANVEILGAPAVGRSGGGLFDEQGRLIGVCNAANANEDEGIYAAAEVVYAQLERLGLAELFDDRLAQGSATPAQPVAFNPSPGAPVGQGSSQLELSQSGSQPQWPDESLPNGAASIPNAGREPYGSQASQVICIVRDAQGKDQMVTIRALDLKHCSNAYAWTPSVNGLGKGSADHSRPVILREPWRPNESVFTLASIDFR